MTKRGPGAGSLKPKIVKGKTIWVGHWMDAAGKRRRKQLSSDKRIAERMLAKIIHERDQVGAGMLTGFEGVTLIELKERYLADLANSCKPSYVKICRRHLDAWCRELGAIRLGDLTPMRVLERRSRRVHAGASHRTANMEVGTLKAALRWAVRHGMLSTSPLLDFRPLPESPATKKKIRWALTDRQIADLLDAAADYDRELARRRSAAKTIAGGTKGRRYTEIRRLRPVPQLPLWKVLIGTGIRWGEAQALRWADIDFEGATLTVRAAVAKSKRARTMPLGQDLLEALSELRRAHGFRAGIMPTSKDRVFLTTQGASWEKGGSNNALRMLRKLLKAAKIEPEMDGATIDIHAMRTTFGTRMARQGMAPQILQFLMGHADITTTMRFYVHLRTEDARAALRGVEPLPVVTLKRPGLRAARVDAESPSSRLGWHGSDHGFGTQADGSDLVRESDPSWLESRRMRA